MKTLKTQTQSCSYFHPYHLLGAQLQEVVDKFFPYEIGNLSRHDMIRLKWRNINRCEYESNSFITVTLAIYLMEIVKHERSHFVHNTINRSN